MKVKDRALTAEVSAKLIRGLFAPPPKQHPNVKIIIAFANGRLSRKDEKILERHLDVCPVCFARAQELIEAYEAR